MSTLARAAVAMVWLYHGLWCKLLGGCPEQAAIVESVPLFSGPLAGWLLNGLGLIETGLAAWVLSGQAPILAAGVQSLLLVAMNAAGLLWGRSHIAEPGAMLVQNAAFLALVWLVARDARADAAAATTGTAWSAGRFSAGVGLPALLFGRMHEDWRIELEVLKPGAPVFCIASAGCTALALARHGYQVTAVDLNPVQVAYVKDRLAGAPRREGRADRLFAIARRFQPMLGWNAVQDFLEEDDLEEQLRAWDGRFDTVRLRAALRVALHPALLALAYRDDLLRALPASFADEIRSRLRRGFALHANRGNPYAWLLLLGHEPTAAAPEPLPPPAAVTLACADAATYLEQAPAESFGGFSLSNILDGATPAYANRLSAAVRHAASPGAAVVLRSFGLPENPASAEWAARDRAFLWGSVRVLPATQL